RSRPDRLPMGEVVGRHRHRHGRERGEGEDRQGTRVRLPSDLYPRGLRGARQGNHPRSKATVVYDSVGKDTFMKSLDCLKPKGMMVSSGQSSGPVGPVDLGIFGQKGSLFFTRPTLNTYAAARADLSAMAKDLFGVVLSGAVKIEIKQTYPLKDAAQAHRD